ncbi:uncharacterized protein LOC6572347, partial [Drosophila mojavensis]|uniref:uncharacterized protein LOC6572347 n=1 Tax=Drosophila mojavensis TaxID=7230 RepID=UPI001CD15EC5
RNTLKTKNNLSINATIDNINASTAIDQHPCRIQTAADMRYLHDLNVQISQKRRSVSVSRQRERDLCNQHFDTFETFWGRPGHGAPVADKINKLKLDNLLYGVPETAAN